MRRAFTLIEILVVVAIIAVMSAFAVANIRSGQDQARLKGSVRDAFATIRHARSMALVSKQPSIITYSTVKEGEENCARIEVHTAKPNSSAQVTEADTLDGQHVKIDDDGEVAEEKPRTRSHTVNGESATVASEGEGQSDIEFLFQSADNEIYRGISLKVIKEGDELADFGEERAKPKISVFSNVDFLLGRFNDDRRRKAAEVAQSEASATSSTVDDAGQSAVSFVWEVNGRTEPHKIWFYRDGTRYDEGLCISVDRFGAAKVLGTGEEDD